MAIQLADIEAARAAIGDQVRNTPIKRSTTLSQMTQSDFHLKLENFQRTGSFKVRGALNKIHSLTDEERARGVVAASAGNHAQGVAFAATTAGVTSHLFMPQGAAHAKVVATKGYGANIHLEGRDYQDAFLAAEAFCNEQGSVFVHAFDDPFIMAGQGTL
ncbi:MAG: threonine ammonia-lyase, partial [Thermoplasmatota archaeon]